MPLTAGAHHGWSEYDTAKALKLTGKIVESGYEHPHGHIRFEAKGEGATAGKTWNVVLAPPSRMENRGLQKEWLKAGRHRDGRGLSQPQQARRNARRAHHH